MATVPVFYEYMNPILKALAALGGSGTNPELYEHVTESMGLTDEQLAIIHDPERGNQTEAGYRMAWAKTYLKKAGVIENSRRGVWALTAEGAKVGEVVPLQIVKSIRDGYSESSPKPEEDGSSSARSPALELDG